VTAAAASVLAWGACGGDGGKTAGDKPDTGPAPSTSDGGTDAGPLVPLAHLDDGVAGSACKANADCKGTNVQCLGNVCSGACETNAHCGAGGSCVTAVAGQGGLCAKVCKAASDCMDGLDCRENVALADALDDLFNAVQDAGISLEGIDASVEVHNLPKTCGESLGTVQLGNGTVGKSCSTSDQCSPGECVTSLNLGAVPLTGGYCTGKCLSDDQCGTGGVCYKDPATAFLKLEGRCLLSCSGSASGCRTGQECRTAQALLDSKTYCLPPAPDAGTAGTPGADAAVSPGG
jgi:hypothetical protein